MTVYCYNSDYQSANLWSGHNQYKGKIVKKPSAMNLFYVPKIVR